MKIVLNMISDAITLAVSYFLVTTWFDDLTQKELFSFTILMFIAIHVSILRMNTLGKE